MTAVDVLRRRLDGEMPATAIILGSSLGAVGGHVEAPVHISYRELPGFPVPKVSGHAGEVIAGTLAGRRVLVLQGRAHPYETGDAGVMRPAIETLAELGVERLVITNAAGSLDTKIRPGRIMLITDHINFAGMNPLIGEPGDQGFVPMTRAYDEALADALRRAGREEKIDLAEGTYMWFSGPSFETPAEIRMARLLGATAVGMSTVPEVMLARRFRLRVAALSVIANLGAGIENASPSHDETMRIVGRAAGDMARLLKRFMAGTVHT